MRADRRLNTLFHLLVVGLFLAPFETIRLVTSAHELSDVAKKPAVEGDTNGSNQKHSELTIVPSLQDAQDGKNEPGKVDPTKETEEQHTVKVVYSKGIGQSRKFSGVKLFLQNNFPELRDHITEGTYTPPKFATRAQIFLKFCQFFALVCCLLGDSVWNYVPFFKRPPEWYFTMKRNWVVALVALFMVLPKVILGFIQLGAFEIELDGEVIFSKLETGRHPEMDDLLQPLIKAGLDRTRVVIGNL